MPVSPAQRDRYAEQMSRLITEAVGKANRAADGVPALVSDALKEINARIAAIPADNWTKTQALPVIRAELKRASDEMGRALLDDVVDGMRDAFIAGSNAVLDPLVSNGIISSVGREGFASIPASLLNVASGFASDLITEVSRDARDIIAGYARRSLLTGKTQIQVMQEIAATINGYGGTALQFGTVFNRSEVIYRTEVPRLLMMSSRVRGVQLDETFPGTTRWWEWSGVGREDHSEMEDRTKAEPIAMEDWYEFDGYALMYPLDPNGRGSEQKLAGGTIQCSCSERYVLPVTSDRPREPGDVEDATEAVIEDVQALADSP